MGEQVKEKAAKKEQKAPEYPKWPEQPAAYTQTVRDRMGDVLSTIEEEGFDSQVEGAKAQVEFMEGILTEAEKPFKKAGAKAWILKSELSTYFQERLGYTPDMEATKELQGHRDLVNLYRRGSYFFYTRLAKVARIEL